MSTLHAFGDSFVFGQIECSHALSHYPDIKITLKKNIYNEQRYDDVNPQHFSTEKDYEYFLKKCDEESFIRIFSNHYNLSLENYAFMGSSNIEQLYMLYDCLLNDKIKKDDYIFFGFTCSVRDIHHNINFSDNDIIEDYHKNLIHYMNILNSLCFLEKKFNLKILKCNLFTDHILNSLLYSNNEFIKKLKNKIDTKYYIGWNNISNTVMDILIDNFYNDSIEKTIAYFNNKYQNEYEEHSHFDVKKYFTVCSDDPFLYKNYEKYFQPRKHPTREGHEKIANFIIEYVNNNYKDFFVINDNKTEEMFIYS